MARRLIRLTVAAIASATLLVGVAPAFAMDLDDLDELPVAALAVPLTTPSTPLLIIPIEVDDD